MNKVVYNACFGGFNISLKAMKWLAENGRDEIKDIAEKNLREKTYSSALLYRLWMILLMYVLSFCSLYWKEQSRAVSFI